MASPCVDTTAHSQGLLVCQGLYSVSLSVTLYILAPAESLVSKQGSRFIHFLTSTAGLGHLVDSLSTEAPLMVLQGQSRGLCMARGWIVLWTVYSVFSVAARKATLYSCRVWQAPSPAPKECPDLLY